MRHEALEVYNQAKEMIVMYCIGEHELHIITTCDVRRFVSEKRGQVYTHLFLKAFK